ncbi:hypothetical protein BKA70DRAFT_1564922 [Coprinopsis sp. MPI-PUGE-AT-0042]|nr:hypothetical protein BKA70DRAFT_1564922 [Coprinopsis sp. MPI-PUGE-AT-0042]
MATTTNTPYNVSVCLRSMDIWYHIAASLDPPDILALRTTCSGLLRICGQRSIWLQATRAMCRSHGLFLPSFPLEAMSIKELMRLALSPYIFSRLVSMQGKGRLPEIHSRTFRPRLERFGKVLEVRSLHLLPGGRYLFTYHEADVCLWDLGYGSVCPSHLPIACLHIGRVCDCYGEKPPCPTEDEKGVRLAVLSANGPGVTWTLGMYDICPESEKPEFRCKTSWQVPAESDILAYSSRYAVLRKSGVVKVYAVGDAENHGPRCSLHNSYSLNSNNPKRNTSKVIILGDTVLVTADNEDSTLNLFSIPRTHASGITRCLPHFLVPGSHSCDPQGPICTSEWAGSSGNNFFVLGGLFSGTAEFDLYRMVDLASLSEPLLPYAIPVKVGMFSAANWCGFLAGPNLQRMASDLATIGITRGNLGVVRFAQVSNNAPQEELTAPSVTLTDEALYEEIDFIEEVSACVATGRLVVANTVNVDGNSEWVVRVIDYLSPA